jgi:N-acetylglutamate synthase-like GNAT family acetyltransferase
MWKKIYNNAFMNKLNEKICLNKIKKRIFNLKSNIDYLYINNEIVGFGMVFNIMNNLWHIDYLAIDPIYQNMGYGKILMNNLINKYKNLSLECNDKLINYYKKFGFIKHNNNYYYDNHQFNIMTNFNIKYNNIKLLINKLNNYNLITLMIYFSYNSLNYDNNNDIRLINNINMINNINYYKHGFF